MILKKVFWIEGSISWSWRIESPMDKLQIGLEILRGPGLTKKNPTDAGWDLTFSPEAGGVSEFMGTGDLIKLPVGIKTEILPGWCGIVKDRSGNSLRGLSVRAGVIDSDYRGEWEVVIQHTGRDLIEIHPGDRIAQVLFVPVPDVEFVKKSISDDTERGSGGFGSTGQ
jgi:dUTP pyrophosphatase